MKGDWKKMVSEYRASGLSQGEFSRLRGDKQEFSGISGEEVRERFLVYPN
jgi:hypothetical protein